jgi:hypothetical protein
MYGGFRVKHGMADCKSAQGHNTSFGLLNSPALDTNSETGSLALSAPVRGGLKAPAYIPSNERLLQDGDRRF